MPNPLSNLGIGHTLISLFTLAAGLASFVRHRSIDWTTRSGKAYITGLVLSVATSFGLSSTGGLNAGHVLGVLALLAACGGVFVYRLPVLAGLHPYVSALLFSFSFFLLGVPGISETLRRLPPAHPVAEGLQSPVLLGTLTAWLALFVVGAALQAWWIRSRRRAGS